MLISRKIKLSFIWVSLLVLASTLLIGLAPTERASALPKEANDRIYISALAFCLYHKYAIDENKDNIKSLASYWDDDGDRPIVAVGYNINKSGVVSCKEIVGPAAQVLGFTPIDGGPSPSDFIESQILGNGETLGKDHPNGHDGNKFEEKARTYIQDVLVDKYLDPNSSSPTKISAPTTKEVAERLLPMVNLCFAFKTGSAFPASQEGVRINDLKLKDSTNINIIQRTENGSEILSQLGIKPSGGFPIIFKIGDLRTHGEGVASENALRDYTWHFYAYGNDNRTDMSKNGYNLDNGRELYEEDINSLVSCRFIESNPGIWQHYLIVGDKLTFDGKTAEDLVSEAEETVDFGVSGAGNTPSCEAADALAWIACPIISGVLSLNDAIFNTFIVPFLKVDPINTNSGIVYSIWSSFRTLGNVLLVFGLLFIVFGQAIGGGLVDAYTAKKAMPRILVAAVLINLSIYLVAFMVDVGNILGAGVGQLILAPLEASGNANYKVDGVAGLVVIIGLFLGLVLALVVARTVKNVNADPEVRRIVLSAALLFGIPALLVILGIFATLVIRLGTILLLCVISPVALALFVMPSTDKWAKKWFDLLVKSILVYPIVVVIFAIAGILSALISSNVPGLGWGDVAAIGAGLALTAAHHPIAGMIIGGVALETMGGGLGETLSSVLTSFLAVGVLFVPLAMIPFSFKLAGGLMGSVLQGVTKARASASKLATGDKHNPHGRYMNFAARAQHNRQHLMRSSLDKMQGTNLADYEKDALGNPLKDASGNIKYKNANAPKSSEFIRASFKRKRKPVAGDTSPKPRFAEPEPHGGVDNREVYEKTELPRPDSTPATLDDARGLLGSTPPPAGGPNQFAPPTGPAIPGGPTGPATPGTVFAPPIPQQVVNTYTPPQKQSIDEVAKPLPGAPNIAPATTQAEVARIREQERYGQQQAGNNTPPPPPKL